LPATRGHAAGSAQAQRIIRTTLGGGGGIFAAPVTVFQPCDPSQLGPADACLGQQRSLHGLADVNALGTANGLGLGTWQLVGTDFNVSSVPSGGPASTTPLFDAASVLEADAAQQRSFGFIRFPATFEGSFVFVLSGTWQAPSDVAPGVNVRSFWSAAYLFDEVRVAPFLNTVTGLEIGVPELRFGFLPPLNGMSTTRVDLYVFTPIPEPGTYALMALGLLGLGAVARRRRTGAA
jgi:hypothetical protein